MTHVLVGAGTSPGVWVVVGGRLVIAVTSASWAAAGAWPELLVGVVALGLTWVPGAIVRDPALRNPVRLLVCVLLAAHVALGMGLALYERSAVYDKWVHLIGFAAITALILAATTRYCARRRLTLPAGLVQLVVLSCGLSLGTCWELFEFAVDRTGWFRAQRGLEDTMLDLVADALGIMLALGAYALQQQARAAWA